MTPFASVALIRRNGSTVFKPPRKEMPSEVTQARKSAMRFWQGALGEGDALVRVFVVRERAGIAEISERDTKRAAWLSRDREIGSAMQEPHLAACLGELGVDPDAAPPAVPDVLVINGFTYRRDI